MSDRYPTDPYYARMSHAEWGHVRRYAQQQAQRAIDNEIPVANHDDPNADLLQALFYLRMAVRHLRAADKRLDAHPEQDRHCIHRDVQGGLWMIDHLDGLIASALVGGTDTQFIVDVDDDDDDDRDQDDPDDSFTPDPPLVAWASR